MLQKRVAVVIYATDLFDDFVADVSGFLPSARVLFHFCSGSGYALILSIHVLRQNDLFLAIRQSKPEYQSDGFHHDGGTGVRVNKSMY